MFCHKNPANKANLCAKLLARVRKFGRVGKDALLLPSRRSQPCWCRCRCRRLIFFTSLNRFLILLWHIFVAFAFHFWCAHFYCITRACQQPPPQPPTTNTQSLPLQCFALCYLRCYWHCIPLYVQRRTTNASSRPFFLNWSNYPFPCQWTMKWKTFFELRTPPSGGLYV